MSNEPITSQIFTRSAHFAPATYDEANSSVEVTWSTGARVLRSSFLSGPFYEELSLNPQSVDLGRLNNGAPVLKVHDQSSLTSTIGVVERAWIDGNKGKALLRFSHREDVKPIVQDIKDGILRNISVGYRVHAVEEQEGRNDNYKTLLVTRWEPLEISFVPVGADAGATVRSDTTTIRSNKLEESVLVERDRVSRILGLTRKFDLAPEFTDELINSGSSLENVREKILERLSAQSLAQAGTHSPIEMVHDERDTRREGMIEALCHRSQVGATLTEKGKIFRSLSLLDMAKQCLGDNSYLGKEDIVARAFHSTSDFPEILGNVAKQQLLASYEKLSQKQNFWPLARVKSAQDFKSMRRVRMGEMPSLQELPEGAEYSYGTLGENAEEYKITTWGKGLGITRQMVINDDLGAFEAIGHWGASIARLESQLFWSILNENPKLSDGFPLFDAKHNNFGKNAELSIDSLSQARIAMAKHQGIDLRDFLNLQAEFLIVPVEMQTRAEQFLSREVVPQEPDKVNPFKGAFKLIATTWLKDPKTWILAASPDQGIDLIEMAYLDGVRQPFIDWHTDFKTDCLQVKARMDIGAKAIDYRGFYKGA